VRRLAALALAGFLAAVVAGCGGETTMSPKPETVIGTLAKPKALKGNPSKGKDIFTKVANPACATCHTYKPAGATAKVGPDLDTALKGKPAAFIQESIVNPSAEIAKGYSDIMPKTYAQALSPQQVADLVAFLKH
jgi:mono/diheme cytochrome c family protein